MKPNDSSLLRTIVAGLKHKRKAQNEDLELVGSEETLDSEEVAPQEERHEVDIMVDIKDCVDRLEDEEIRSELTGLLEELAKSRGIDQDVESVSDISDTGELDEELDDEIGEELDDEV